MTTDHTPDLDALERLLEEATQGPWSVEPFPRGEGTWYGRVRGVYNGHSCVVANVDDINDTHLIAAAINALPALIAAARERERLKSWQHGATPIVTHATAEQLYDVAVTAGHGPVLVGGDTLRDALAAGRQQRHKLEQAERVLSAYKADHAEGLRYCKEKAERLKLKPPPEDQGGYPQGEHRWHTLVYRLEQRMLKAEQHAARLREAGTAVIRAYNLSDTGYRWKEQREAMQALRAALAEGQDG